MAGNVAAAVCRLARHEQRHLLGLVPLPRLPPLLAAVLSQCFTILATDVEVRINVKLRPSKYIVDGCGLTKTRLRLIEIRNRYRLPRVRFEFLVNYLFKKSF